MYIIAGYDSLARGKEREREKEMQRRQITDPRSLNSRSVGATTRPTCVVEDGEIREQCVGLCFTSDDVHVRRWLFASTVVTSGTA